MTKEERLRLRSNIKMMLMQWGFYTADENCHDVARVLRHLADGYEEKDTENEL